MDTYLKHDVAAAHSTCHVRQFLNGNFVGKWSDSGGPVK